MKNHHRVFSSGFFALVFLVSSLVFVFQSGYANAAVFSRPLSVGSEGEDVTLLQRVLNSIGFPVSNTGPGSGGNETSYFGSQTALALQSFQCSHGIVCEGGPYTTGFGLLGPKTRSFLSSLIPSLQASFSSINSGSQLAAIEGSGSGLVGWWRFDEGSGTAAADSSGSGNNGTLTGSVLPTWTLGKIGQGLDFTSGGYVDAGDAISLRVTTLTVSAWIKLDQKPGAQACIVAKHSWGYRFCVDYNGYLEANVYSSSNTLLTGTTNIVDGLWHHVVWTFTPNTTSGSTVYIDGVSHKSVNSNGGDGGAGVRLKIGQSLVTANQFYGLLDDVRIYNRALTASEVGELYNAGFNQAPIVSAGTNQTITLPENATFSGTVSDDGLPIGSSITTTWAILSGPGSVTFGNVNALSTTAAFSAAGTYVLQLLATDSALTSVAYISVTVNPAVLDTTPPVISLGTPSGTLPIGTTQTTFSVTTSELAVCKYGVIPNVSYDSIGNTFLTTGGTSHSSVITNLTDGATYNYYVRCQDTANNQNIADYLISFSVLSAVSGGTIYYVDSIGGNDSWDGKSQTYTAPNHGPWKTSVRVNSGVYAADDKILFKRGGIYGRLLGTSDMKGTNGHPITFGAYGTGEKPIITNASTIITGWTDLGDGRYSKSVSAIDTVLEDWHAIKKANSSSVGPGEYFIDTVSSMLYYKPSSGTPENHEVRVGNAAGFSFYQKADNFTIQDLHFIGGGLWHGQNDPTPFGNIIVERCEFTGNAAIWVTATIDVTAFNFIIQDSLFKNNRSNIYIIAQNHGTWDGVIIRRNKFIDTDIMWDGTRYSSWAPGDIDGISVQNVMNSIFEENEISGGTYTGGITVWFNLGFSGTGNIIRYNYIHDIDTFAIGYGGEDNGTSNVEIYGNIIANVGNTPPPYGTYWGGIRLNREQTLSNPSRVYNNVIYNADANYYLYTRSDNYVLNNNISLNPRSGKHIVANFGELNNGFDNNLYFGPTNKFNLSYIDYAFDAWKTVTGQDTASMVADPKLVSTIPTATADFKLQAGSPAINSGKNVGLTVDYFGTSVPQGSAPDIGVHEYDSSTVPVPVNGVCGLVLNSCTTGTFSDVSDSSTHYLWSCVGSNGGTTASCSLPIPPLADITAPTVNVTVPLNNATVSGTVTLSADATDLAVTGQTTSGVAGVQFKLDGINLGSELTTVPYSGVWDTVGVSNGTHIIVAVARDVAGNIATSSNVVITVSNLTSDVTPPSVPTGLSASSITTSSVSLSWNPSTDPVVNGAITSGVLGYNLYRNGSFLVAVTNPSYIDTGLTSGTNYSYSVSSFDMAGNVGSQSSSLLVSIPVPPPPPAPTVVLTSPSEGQTFTALATITIAANASETGGTISRVEFYAASSTSALLFSDTVAPYTYTWQKVPAGVYSITAKAYDTNGKSTISSPVSIIVKAKKGGKPLEVQKLSASSGSVKLSWRNPVEDADYHHTEVYRSATRFLSTPVASALVYSGTSENYRDSSVKSSTTYYYSVYAVDSTNSYSNPSYISFTTPLNAENVMTTNPMGGGGTVAVSSVGTFTPATPSPSSCNSILSDAQTSSILNLLSSFNADAAVIANVKTSLCKKNMSAMSSIGSTQFVTPLKLGMKGSDVKNLQQFLNQQGFLVADSGAGSLGLESGYFGISTQNALMRFQKANNITPVTGYFGPITMKKVNEMTQ